MEVTVTMYFRENTGETLEKVMEVLNANDKNFEVRGKIDRKRRIVVKKVDTELFCELAQIPGISLWA